MIKKSQGCQTPENWNTHAGSYPIMGDESLMARKEHGTSHHPVQTDLRYNCDRKVADRICNFNRHYAEHAGYFMTTAWPTLIAKDLATTYYDSNSGNPLFHAPVNRSFSDFLILGIFYGFKKYFLKF